MKKIKDEIIIELKELMNEKNLSAGMMSRLIGCERSQISRWINGKARPTLIYRKMIRKGITKAKKL